MLSVTKYENLGVFVIIFRLRQSDPLSPYLFILVSEVLTRNIADIVQEGSIKGLKLRKNCPLLHNLFFADDFFREVDDHSRNTLLAQIRVYFQASGQKVNVDKSKIMFSGNITVEVQERIAALIQIKVVNNAGSFLSNLLIGSSLYGLLQEKLEGRTSSWKSKLLSLGGKEVLLKSVAQALPGYVISEFKLLKIV